MNEPFVTEIFLLFCIMFSTQPNNLYMKYLIFTALLFSCLCANAQGKFVQAVYVHESQCCNVVTASGHSFKLYLYNDTSVTFELMACKYAYRNSDSFVHTFMGKGYLVNDTLRIKYTSFSQKLSKKKHTADITYTPGINELFFTPPSTFIIEGNTIRDANSDFPILNKVSIALAMNTPQPK